MIRTDRRIARVGIAVAAASALAFSLPLSFASADDAAIACLEAGNVWVVVEHDAGLLADGCATEFATGIEALTSAGIEFTDAGGFVGTIVGEPSDPGPEDWWSYWTGTPGDDGSVAWESYQVGATESEPQAGTIEGWRLAYSWSEQAPPPTSPDLTPSETPTPSPSPTPTEVPTETPAPTTSPTPSATSTPAAPGKPSLPSTGN